VVLFFPAFYEKEPWKGSPTMHQGRKGSTGKRLCGLTDANSVLEIKIPQVSIAIDRDKARAMGVSA